MKYLKVFTDFASSLEPLGDAECGRLFKAMLEYARTGQEPDFRGNERFIWPTAKQSIDRDSETYRRKVDAALKATEKRYRTQMYDNVQKETSTCDNAQDKDKDKDKDDARTRAGSSKGREAPRAEDTVKRYRKPEACDPPQGEGAGRNKGREAPRAEDTPRAEDSGIIAPLLSEEEADRLGAEYTRNMQTLLAALEDIGMKSTARNEQAAEALMAQYGLEKLLAAIDTAAEHDNRGGVSWAYLRRILEDGPRQSAAGKPAATRTIRECCVVDGQEVWTERVVRAQ